MAKKKDFKNIDRRMNAFIKDYNRTVDRYKIRLLQKTALRNGQKPKEWRVYTIEVEDMYDGRKCTPTYIFHKTDFPYLSPHHSILDSYIPSREV